MTERRAAPDWERIQIQYRTNTMSLREIASEHGMTEGAVRKHAKKHGWERDLSQEVRTKADALVRTDLVRTEVRTDAAARTPSERHAIEVEATVQSRIRIAHRQDIGRARALAMKLLEELEQQTDSQETFERLMNLLLQVDPEQADEGDKDKHAERCRRMREQWQKAMSLGPRVDTMRKLAETLKVLIDKEREAFGINGSDPPSGDFQGALQVFMSNLHSMNARLPMARRA